MALEQNTVAAINEIDRTLRSLGIREIYPETRLPPLHDSYPLDAKVALPVRQTSSSQTASFTRVTTGTQSYTSMRSTSVQHSPSRRTCASQTDNTMANSEAAELKVSLNTELLQIVERAQSIEQTTAHMVETLIDKLEVMEDKVSHFVHLSRSSAAKNQMRFVESEELTQRLNLECTETSTRGEIALSCLLEERRASVQTLLTSNTTQKAIRKGYEEVTSRDSKQELPRQSSHTSLNDLTYLLDECWKVLEE